MKLVKEHIIFEKFTENEKIFNITSNKFQLFLNNILVSETHFSIEYPDNLFNKKYVGIFKLKTNKKFRGKGFAKYLLEKIFNYVRNHLKIKYILLNVYKDNQNAVKLYFNAGFEIYKDYDVENPYFTLIKNL